MTIDILQALSQQKIDAYAHQKRIIVKDGLLSVSDEVMECRMRELGFDKNDRDEWLLEPVELRGEFMRQWDMGVK